MYPETSQPRTARSLRSRALGHHGSRLRRESGHMLLGIDVRADKVRNHLCQCCSCRSSKPRAHLLHNQSQQCRACIQLRRRLRRCLGHTQGNWRRHCLAGKSQHRNKCKRKHSVDLGRGRSVPDHKDGKWTRRVLIGMCPYGNSGRMSAQFHSDMSLLCNSGRPLVQ